MIELLPSLCKVLSSTPSVEGKGGEILALCMYLKFVRSELVGCSSDRVSA
jgi:hypothetical protein